jgi:hypothetical protein
VLFEELHQSSAYGAKAGDAKLQRLAHANQY